MSLQALSTGGIPCPACSRCGSATRVYGVERHAEYENTDIRTFVCDGCETVEVRVIQNLLLN